MSADAPERHSTTAPERQVISVPSGSGTHLADGPVSWSQLADASSRSWRSPRSWQDALGDEAATRTVVVGAAALLVVAAAALALLQPLPREQVGTATAGLQVMLAALGAAAWWRWRGHHDRTVAVMLAACCVLVGLAYGASLAPPALTESPVTRWVMLVSFVGGQVSYLAALAHLSRGRRAQLGWADVVQAVTLFILISGVLWVLAPITGQAVDAFPAALRWIPYFYVGASMLGLVLAWYALFRHRERAVPGLGLLCLGKVVLAITVFSVVINVVAGDYQMGGTLDLGGMMATGLLIAAAAAREEPTLTWQRARQRLVLVTALLLVVGVLAVGVTGLVQDASARIADHHERGAMLRHGASEIARLRSLESDRPLDAEGTDLVTRTVIRARTDLNGAVALADGLGADSPASDVLVTLPGLLNAYRDSLLAGPDDVSATATRRAHTRLDRALARVLETSQQRLTADVEALDRVTAIVRLGVPLGLVVLGGAFVSSWMALGHRERALEQAQARHELTKEVVRAQERERGRIAAELHDGPLQQVAAWRIKLEMAMRKLDTDPAAAREALARLDEEVAGQAVELRRLMHALRPPVLDEFGLSAAVRMLAEEAAERGGFEVGVEVGDLGDVTTDREIETLVYRILQEVLTNVGKHAAATRASVLLQADREGLSLLVTDDGRGMAAFAPDRLVKEGHFGLAGVSERVELVGGSLQVSSAPGEGTSVEAWLPARLEGPRRVG